MNETQKRSSTVAKDTDREKSLGIFSLHGVPDSNPIELFEPAQ
jgi:hypothetical protein